MWEKVTSLPNQKFLDQSKLKTFADDKTNADAKLKFVLQRVEKIMGKGKNAGYHNVFKRLPPHGC